MASILALSNEIVARIAEVKVYHDYFASIQASITSLQHYFKNLSTTSNNASLHEDLTEILSITNEIIIGCCQNENFLNDITHEDLETMLLLIQFRLTQIEVNVTDDSKAKVIKLEDIYRNQQFYVKRTLNGPIKQKLEAIEQTYKQNNVEQHRALREKHRQTVESYIRRCFELHEKETVASLDSDTIVRIARSKYGISVIDQSTLAQTWQSFKHSLARIFIAVTSDKSNPFDGNVSLVSFTQNNRNKLRSENNKSEATTRIWKRLISSPYILSVVEKDLQAKDEDLTLENIIRNRRWICIQGDSGTGKTHSMRWLVCHLGRMFLMDEQYSTNYGLLRIPILIDTTDFAQRLTEQPSLTLFDYIGKHSWMGKPMVDESSISNDDLSDALQDYIRQNQALIIFDRLHEIPTVDEYLKVTNAIEIFLDTYIRISDNISTFDNIYLSKLIDDPSRFGGNQVILLSRRGFTDTRYSYYTVQPMNIKHMQDFVRDYFVGMHQNIIEILGLQYANQGIEHSEALIKELEKTENVPLVKIISKPRLLSFLCALSISQLDGSPLLGSLSIVYDKLILYILDEQSSVDKSMLIQILSNIAIYISDHSPTGLIHENELKHICIQSIQNACTTDKPIEEKHGNIDIEVLKFVKTICEDIRILVVHHESYYKFVHDIIQEYFIYLQLTGRYLSKSEKCLNNESSEQNDIKLFVQSFHNRFRLHIGLILSKISHSWTQCDFDEFCCHFINDENEANAFILIKNFKKFVKYPSNNVIFMVLDRLITVASHRQWPIVCPFLFDQIIYELRNLPKDIVPLWINKVLNNSSSYTISIMSTFCQLIEGKPHEFDSIQYLNPSLCSIIQSLAISDNNDNQFCIERLLIKVAFTNPELLDTHVDSFKYFLLDKKILMNSIHTVLYPLIISLYGGLKCDGQTIIFDPLHIYRESKEITPILIRYFSENHSEKNLRKLQQACIKLFLSRIQNYDESSETVDLCMATISFYGIEYIQDNLTMIPSSLLLKVMHRLKFISMILRQFYFVSKENIQTVGRETTQYISIIVKKFQYIEAARNNLLDLIDSLKSGLARLTSSSQSILLKGFSNGHKQVQLNLPDSFRINEKFITSLLTPDIQWRPDEKSCSLLHCFLKLFITFESNTKYNTQNSMLISMDKMLKYLTVHNDEDTLFILTFIPPHVRNLYLQLLKRNYIINNVTENQIHPLYYTYFSHILTECSMYLSNPSFDEVPVFAAIIVLFPLFQKYKLENLISFFCTIDAKYYNSSSIFSTILNPFKKCYAEGNISKKINEINQYRKVPIQRRIDHEYKILQNTSSENDEGNMKLYSASISLAYISRWVEEEMRSSLFDKSIKGALSIQNPFACLDALCTIRFYSQTILIDNDKNQFLTHEIESQYNKLHFDLPPLLHALIFIRCLPLLQRSNTIDNSLRNLFHKCVNMDQRDQKALREALHPYFLSNLATSSIANCVSYNLQESENTIFNKSSIFKKYFNHCSHENLSLSLSITNMYLMELTKDFYKCITADSRHFINNEIIIQNLIPSDSSTLTEMQILSLTNILQFILSSNQPLQFDKFLMNLNQQLHRMNLVEFKAFPILESWLQWKCSNELYPFAYHAAILLINSKCWSVESATILCDLLCHEDDRFRQRAETICLLSDNKNMKTSSILGIHVLLVLCKKYAHFHLTCASAKEILRIMLRGLTVDVQSHLEIILWLERYRIHASQNRNYSINNKASSSNAFIAAYFSTCIEIDSCSFINTYSLSFNLVNYMCDMIASNFFLFLEIDGDTTSSEIVRSHAQFVTSTILTLYNIIQGDYETGQIAITALMNLFDGSNNNDIRQAIAYSLSYLCDDTTYKSLYEKIILEMSKTDHATTDDSFKVLNALILSYSYCMSMKKIPFDQDDIDLFSNLMKHKSSSVSKSIRIGFGRVLKDRMFLFDMLAGDYTQCYNALVGATAYIFISDIRENSRDNLVAFIEEHPALLPVFIIGLYESICHLTDKIENLTDRDFDFACGYPQYLEAASSIVMHIPEVFCSFIMEWPNRENFKRALFYASKQDYYLERAAALTILSSLGELTVDLCEMFKTMLLDQPFVQNVCHSCITHIRSIKDERLVLDFLSTNSRSRSMNVRYHTAKLLTHLSKSLLIPFETVQLTLSNMILDPNSNESLCLIEEKDALRENFLYYYAGSLKDMVYSLLIQYLTGESSKSVPRNEYNDVDSHFIDSEIASRLATCLY